MGLDSLEDTAELGHALASLLLPGDVILLSGDLGAGKTTITRFIAQGLGIDPREVTSPTFAIIHEYPEGRIPLVHADLYRLGQDADILETGLEEYLDGEFALVMEWGEFLPAEYTGDCLKVELRHAGETGRVAVIEASGSSWPRRLEELPTGDVSYGYST